MESTPLHRNNLNVYYVIYLKNHFTNKIIRDIPATITISLILLDHTFAIF